MRERQALGVDGGTAAIRAHRYRFEGAGAFVSRGFPRALLELCHPSAGGARAPARRVADAATGALTLRPARGAEVAVPTGADAENGTPLAPRAYMIVERVISPTMARALVFEEEDWRAAAPAILSALPSLLPAEGVSDLVAETEDGAAEIADLAMLDGVPPPVGAETIVALLEDEARPLGELILAKEAVQTDAAFWRALGAVADALPPTLRPLLSAESGVVERDAGVLISFGPAVPRGETETPAAETGGLVRMAARLSGRWRLPWEDAATATAALRSVFQDSVEGPAQQALKAYLTEFDQSAAPTPSSGAAREAQLRRLVAAAHTGAAFGETVPPFGLARAAGLIAIAATDSDQRAWRQIRDTQPSRSFWSALLLQSPDWVEDDPIGSLDALSRLFAFDATVREALPADAQTPLDGPAFRRRIQALAARGAALLDAEPLALVADDPDGLKVAPWVRRLADLFDAAPRETLPDVFAALAAIERAGRLRGDDPLLLTAVGRVRSATPTIDPVAALAKPEVASDAVEAAEDFLARWRAVAGLSAGRAAIETEHSGPAFWASAFKAWLSEAKARAVREKPERFFADLDRLAAGLDRAFDRPLGVDAQARAALQTAMTAALQALNEREETPAARFESLSPLWLGALRRDGGATGASLTAEALRYAALAAAADLASSDLASSELASSELAASQVSGVKDAARGVDGAAVGPGAVDAATFAARVLETLSAFAETAASRGVGGALRFAHDALDAFLALGPAARPASATVLAELGRMAAAPDPQTGRRVRDAHPDAVEAIVDKVVVLVLSWGSALSASAKAKAKAKTKAKATTKGTLGAPDDAGAIVAPHWPLSAPDALSELVVERLGAPLAVYAGRYPVTPAADALLDPPAGAAAVIEKSGTDGVRSLAFNAMSSWRAHFEATASARRSGEAARAPVGLSVFDGALDAGSSVADGVALEAVETLFRKAPDEARTAFGEDVFWTLQQFAGLPASPKDRPKDAPAFVPAPETVRAAWRSLANASAGGEAGETGAEPFGSEGFFLFLASKLFARSGGRPRPLIGDLDPFFLKDFATVRTRAGALQEPATKWLREYIYLDRPTERADAIANLTDDEMAARFDRALLFLNLIVVDASGREKSDATALWEARPMPIAAAERLDPPPKIVERLGAFLHNHNDARRALAWTYDGARLYFLPGWGKMKAAIYA